MSTQTIKQQFSNIANVTSSKGRLAELLQKAERGGPTSQKNGYRYLTYILIAAAVQSARELGCEDIDIVDGRFTFREGPHQRELKPVKFVQRFLNCIVPTVYADRIVTACQPTRYEIVDGHDIAEIYNTQRRPHSCMAGKPLSWFSVYADNPETIAMLIGWRGDRLVVRGLPFRDAERGKVVFGSIYSNTASDKQSAINILQRHGVAYYLSHSASVKIKHTDYDEWPYIDEFCWVDTRDNYLHTSNVGNCICAQDQYGGLQEGLPCCECGDIVNEDEVIYVDALPHCDCCFNAEFTVIDYRIYRNCDIEETTGELISDDCLFADSWDAIEVGETMVSSYSDIELIDLDGTIGTFEEHTENDFVYIDDKWFHSCDVKDCDDYDLVGDSFVLRDNAIDTL